MLHFPEQSPTFATTKTENDMERTDAFTLGRLFRLLETEAATLPDFPAACRRLRVLPGPLNELLLCELGVCGEELLQLWRKMTRFADLTNN